MLLGLRASGTWSGITDMKWRCIRLSLLTCELDWTGLLCMYSTTVVWRGKEWIKFTLFCFTHLSFKFDGIDYSLTQLDPEKLFMSNLALQTSSMQHVNLTANKKCMYGTYTFSIHSNMLMMTTCHPILSSKRVPLSIMLTCAQSRHSLYTWWIASFLNKD